MRDGGVYLPRSDELRAWFGRMARTHSNANGVGITVYNQLRPKAWPSAYTLMRRLNLGENTDAWYTWQKELLNAEDEK